MLKIAYADLETTAINNWSTLDGLTEVLCMSVLDYQDKMVTYTKDSVMSGFKSLEGYDIVVFHNGINFDIPAIKKFYPGFKLKCTRDTYVMSSAMYSDIAGLDRQKRLFPKDLIGRHSLKAWGYRLGENKGDFGEDADWTECTPEMIEYCEQDVRVTKKLYDYLMSQEPSEVMLKIEHKFADIMRSQEERGWKFDVQAAEDLTFEIMHRRALLEDKLKTVFPPKELEMKAYFYNTPDGKEWGTKQQAVKQGYKANEIERGRRKVKVIPFNPSSRDQIAERLIEKYNWKPKLFTPAGKPKVDEGVLKQIDAPEAKYLCTYLMCIKRLGQLAEGKEAWLKAHNDGIIHGRVLTNGTVSGRCSHRNPNIAQTPASSAPYGEDCRKLFKAREGFKLVGFDASGLELRCLGHYLFPYDNGRYAKEVVDGDVHTLNQKAAGLKTRNDAKRFIYALNYGCGDQLLGEMVDGGIKEGKALRAKFLSRLPALKKLMNDVSRSADKGYIKAIDGRRLNVRSQHVALNLLLQSCGAIIMKTTSCFLSHKLKEANWELNKQYAFVGNIHDEIQTEVLVGLESTYGKLAQESIRDAGKYLNFRCRLDGEYHIGDSWAETH